MVHKVRDKQKGRIDRKKVEETTEADIERMMVEDGEHEWFDKEAAPDRVIYPARVDRTASGRSS